MGGWVAAAVAALVAATTVAGHAPQYTLNLQRFQRYELTSLNMQVYSIYGVNGNRFKVVHPGDLMRIDYSFHIAIF